MKAIKNNEKNPPFIQKKLSFGLVLFSFTYTLLWSEVPVALLESVHHNTQMVLKYKNSSVLCQPFGIKSLEMIQQQTPNQQECQKAVQAMYQKNPSVKYFAKKKLHLQQTYHFNLIEKKCVLYANGPESYSEMLLAEGLAVIDESFDDKEWNEKLKKAYMRGMKDKKGIHHENTEILNLCIKKEKG